jgi:hypothetical protein
VFEKLKTMIAFAAFLIVAAVAVLLDVLVGKVSKYK